MLVLDDVHLLTDWECIAGVAALVEHLPNESQIALSGRADVPVPVARLRTEGRLVEVGTDEMRLSKREASVLLRAAGVELPDEEIAELTNRTEGWPAGLYLAALSLRTTHSPTSAFRGADRFVSDYFRSELLANLPPSRIEFLTRLSVLDRMCGALCDAVLDGSGSAIALEDLEQSNLFVIPLDHERRWYRFHHLFRDMLRDELERRELALIPTLNGRAADWCEQQGDIDAAIEYAHAAGDQDRFVRLVEAAMLPTYWRGRYATVERWLSGVLDDSALLERYPAVAVYGAEFYALLGRADHAERWRDAAERSTTDRPMPDGSPVTAWKALARAFAGQGGAVGMLDDAALAAATLAPTSPFRTNALIVLGTALMLAGNDARADSVLAEATETGSSSGAIPGVSLSLAQRSLLAIGRDDWPAAHALVAEAREVMRAGQLEDYVTMQPHPQPAGRHDPDERRPRRARTRRLTVPVEFIGMIGAKPGSETDVRRGPAIDHGYLRDFARAHDEAGFDRVLIGYGSSQPDGLQVAAYARRAHRAAQLPHRPPPRRSWPRRWRRARSRRSTSSRRPHRRARHLRRQRRRAAARRRHAAQGRALRAHGRVPPGPRPRLALGDAVRLRRAATTRSRTSSARPARTQQPRIPALLRRLLGRRRSTSAPATPTCSRSGASRSRRRPSRSPGCAPPRRRPGRDEPPRISVSFRPILGDTDEEAWERAHRILEVAEANLDVAPGHRQALRPRQRGARERRLPAAAGGWPSAASCTTAALWTPIAAADGRARQHAPRSSGQPGDRRRRRCSTTSTSASRRCSSAASTRYDDAVDYGRDLIPLVREEAARLER